MANENEKELAKVRTGDKDQKKKSALAAAKAKQNQNQNKTTIKEYFRGVRVEMKKVVWPTPRELMAYTWTVLFTCFAFGFLFWVTDALLMQGLKMALGFEFS
ncbi:MAG: preprotein translocase subunit SecE [Clostridiales Family XIII bacterium]|jgi:preprotein translocase subunit SecE|nr:preprotein translocase subunit SecE [Clostridiales Family XIII bacterium]